MASLLRADHTRKFNLSFDNFQSFTFSELLFMLSTGENIIIVCREKDNMTRKTSILGTKKNGYIYKVFLKEDFFFSINCYSMSLQMFSELQV